MLPRERSRGRSVATCMRVASSPWVRRSALTGAQLNATRFGSPSAILDRSTKLSPNRFAWIRKTGFKFVQSIARSRKILNRFETGLSTRLRRQMITPIIEYDSAAPCGVRCISMVELSMLELFLHIVRNFIMNHGIFS